MDTGNPPPIVILPSNESGLDVPVRPGWKADHEQLKLGKRCGNCQTPIRQHTTAVVVRMEDPEGYAEKHNVTLANARRTSTYCDVTCARRGYFNLMANLKKPK